jgi:hypothetical protein
MSGEDWGDAARGIVKSWNRNHPVGTRVKCWPGVRGDESGFETSTRSAAAVLGGHTPVVWVRGHSGCIALSHIEVLP